VPSSWNDPLVDLDVVFDVQEGFSGRPQRDEEVGVSTICAGDVDALCVRRVSIQRGLGKRMEFGERDDDADLDGSP
jgi:hypothetical protein